MHSNKGVLPKFASFFELLMTNECDEDRRSLLRLCLSHPRFDCSKHPSPEFRRALAATVWDASELTTISDLLSRIRLARAFGAIDALVRQAQDLLPKNNTAAHSIAKVLLWFLCPLVELAAPIEQHSLTASPLSVHMLVPQRLAGHIVHGQDP